MKESYYVMDNEDEESLHLKETLLKYLGHWPWFAISVLICVAISFIYLRYAPSVYASVAKVKIIDDTKELDIASDALSLLGGGSKINLDNEIEILKSYRLLEQVVNSLNLEISYHEVGNVKTRKIYNPPFKITKLFPDDSLTTVVSYKIDFSESKPKIIDEKGNFVVVDSSLVSFTKTDFPVQIQLNENSDLRAFRSSEFRADIHKKKETVLNLAGQLEISATNKNSEVLSLKLMSESPRLSEAILNEIIYKFDQDGILDRQLVSKRTLDFIDDRFVYLSTELDSIESGKKEYKQSNNLSYIEADAGMTMQKKSLAENEVFQLETQVALSKLLKQTLDKETSYSLLPADIGLENNGINSLVSEYNQIALEREKLITSAGENNPTVKVLSDQLARGKRNIVNTVDVYRNQLSISLKQLEQEKSKASAVFSRLPEKEKMLRAIERQQSIKENLFLLLLQKREESAINLAVTAPSIKVVDYGLTANKPISPKKSIVFAASLLMGLLLPFGFLYAKFTLDTRIKGRSDLERLSKEIPVLAEIPSLKDTKTFFESNDRSVRAESFKILGTNINYLLPKNKEGKIIYVTSSVKGEGKTLVALNLSLAYASIKKKVLLLGADLRNPQLHTYFNIDKNTTGLSDFLHNQEIAWEDCIHDGYTKSEYHKVCFSGPIPPNASELLASDGLKVFLEKAKSIFDIIIVDTAPTVLVADTLLMSENADVTLFVARAEYTDKKLIEFSKGLNKDKKLKNMAYVINDVKFDKKRGYNYGYEYGYGS